MSNILYSFYKKNEITALYKTYILKLLDEFNNKESIKTNIAIGYEKFFNYKKLIKIMINYDQLLLGSNHFSNDYSNPDRYIQNIDFLNNFVFNVANRIIWSSSDMIIDYSIINKSITQVIKDKSMIKQTLYIPPLFYEYNPFTNKRDINIITTGNFHIERRAKFCDNMYLNNMPLLTITNSYSYESDLNLYKNTKILINIHATASDMTFEELRCLPALLSGVIVISEESPFKELLPYKDFIIWSSIENMVEKTKEVMNNYESYYNAIFINSNIAEIFKKMKTNSTESLTNCLKNYDNIYNNIE